MDIPGEGWVNDYGTVRENIETGTVVGPDEDGNGIVVRAKDGSTRIIGEVTPRDTDK